LKVLGVIPARLHSTRLPKKVLREIIGHPMIEYVYQRAKKCDLLTDVLIATDSKEVMATCKKVGINAIMTGEHSCGSDRLYEVLTKTDADIYVNIQGDEPMVSPDQLRLLLCPFIESKQTMVTTLCTPISDEDAQDPSNVKVVIDKNGNALYFSRWSIPYDRDGKGAVQRFKHIGLYGYRRDTLEHFHHLPTSPLEEAEKLEQLRLLSNGIPIHVIETTVDTIGVDTEEDLKQVEAYFFSHPEEQL
jgi:3-deoxy-manno-octulosonate cytidylyltransferase (CMP-KDO synthetase)